MSAKQTERLYYGQLHRDGEVHPRYLTGEWVEILAYLMAFLVAVAADVVGHIICKWLDRYDDDRKPN